MTKSELPVLGWREWVALPRLGVERIKCKVDTGARTSALHAFFIEPFEADGIRKVRFGLHPFQRRVDVVRECVCDVVDRRMVADSGGHREVRFVINTTIRFGDHKFDADFTLTDRESMMFRMLLGRTAIERRFVVDPARSYSVGRPSKKTKRKDLA